MPVMLRLVASASRRLPQPLLQALFHVPLLSPLIRGQLNVFLPSGLTDVVVGSGALRGTRLSLDLKSEKVYWLGAYEPQLVRAVDDFCKKGMVAYDIGAHIGYVSLVLAQSVGLAGRVYAFEPFPENVRRIEQHVASNSLHSVIQVIPYAVSDSRGTATFMVHREHAMGRLAGSADGEDACARRIDVGTLSLDDFVYQDNNSVPDLIKIDIEGGAVKAIPGMRRILAERRPVLFIELHGPQEQAVVLGTLREHGYRISRMQAGYPELDSQGALAWKEHVVALP